MTTATESQTRHEQRAREAELLEQRLTILKAMFYQLREMPFDGMDDESNNDLIAVTITLANVLARETPT